MAVFYEKTKIGDGIFLTKIADPKYKTNVIRIRFTVPVEPDNSGVNSLLMTLLVTSNSEIKERSKLSSEFLGLYGTSIGSVAGNVGDYQTMGISVNAILDKYTIGGEVISEEAVRQLLLCTFSPDITDGKFNESYFKLSKQELLDSIAAAINDKRSYAYSKAKEVIYEGEPAANSNLGTKERAEAITQEDVLRQYRYLLESAEIDIMVCGGGEIDSAVKMLTEAFLKIERKNVVNVRYRAFSPVKAEVADREEYIDIKQNKLFMAYKSDYEDIYVCKVMACILGGSPFSKLFTNVREKLSVCYYCDSYYNDLKGVMMIESGVNNENIEKTKEAVREQLESVCRGEITDDELENTKRLIAGNFMSNYDSEWDIAAWYETQTRRGTSYTPEEVCELLNAVTKEQVIECARSFKEDTVFILRSKEEGADE